MSRKHRELPSLEELNKIFEYNSETGELTYKIRRGRKAAGSNVGTVNNYGYLVCMKEVYLVHRIAWYMHTGTDPKEMIVDHIDGNRVNNRIDNLRLATHSENMQNANRRGIHWSDRDQRWCSSVQVGGKRVYVGAYVCPLLARVAYEDKKKELHGEFSSV